MTRLLDGIILYWRALMKIVRLFAILLLIAMSACSTAHKEIVVKQDIIPGWKLGYEHLGVLSVALDHKDEVREYVDLAHKNKFFIMK